MSKGIVHTQAGDDSDGKIWGIEGANILFLLAGLLISVGLILMLSRHHGMTVAIGIGVVPFAVLTSYVLCLRQGRPKSFDTDLLETLASGPGWTPPVKQPQSPLLPHASA